jgi:putative restriction endonuclease
LTGWVDSLSREGESNWEICKRVGMWGTPSNASRAQAGDDLFLWKPLPDSGWLVHCRLTSDPRKPRPGEVLPWTDGRTYEYLMDIEVFSEPETHLRFRGAEAAAMAGLAHYVQIGQFAPMSDEGLRRISALFPAPAPPSRLEQALAELLAAADVVLPPDVDQRDWSQRLIAVRRGQEGFREGLLDAFGRSCCISGSRVEATLEAAHIRPYRGPHSHTPGNGLLLRADLHTLFDLHLITVMPYGTVRVAPDLIGSEYEEFDERLIRRPSDARHRPAAASLAEHNAACAWLVST